MENIPKLSLIAKQVFLSRKCAGSLCFVVTGVTVLLFPVLRDFSVILIVFELWFTPIIRSGELIFPE